MCELGIERMGSFTINNSLTNAVTYRQCVALYHVCPHIPLYVYVCEQNGLGIDCMGSFTKQWKLMTSLTLVENYPCRLIWNLLCLIDTIGLFCCSTVTNDYV